MPIQLNSRVKLFYFIFLLPKSGINVKQNNNRFYTGLKYKVPFKHKYGAPVAEWFELLTCNSTAPCRVGSSACQGENFHVGRFLANLQCASGSIQI